MLAIIYTLLALLAIGQPLCAPPADIQFVDHQRVDAAVAGDVRWHYTANAGAYDISNIKLEICPTCTLSEIQLCGAEVPATAWEFTNGILQIDYAIPAGQSCPLTFRATCRQYEGVATWAIKSGQCDASGLITGPSCTPNAVNLISLEATRASWLTWFWDRVFG